MRLRQLLRPCRIGLWLVVLIMLLLQTSSVAAAREGVTVRLDQVGGSGVRGTAILTAAGEGTQVVLEVEGLAPGTTARATMHANTCTEPSASFAALPKLTADAGGNVRATGSILYLDTDAVALATMADGEHIIGIQTGQMVACGVIPRR